MVEKILRPRLLAILLFGTTVCLTAVWATRQYGLGVSTDGVDYMFTSLNLVKGNGFISYNASPYTLWPPLYPILLAGFQVFSGFDPLMAAAALNIITGILFAFALGFLISAAFPGWFGWAALTGLIVFLSPTIFLLAQTVNSDYLFVLFVALFLLEASNAIQNHERGSLIRLFLLGMLASMQRYIGVTLILSSALIVLLYYQQPYRRRLLLAAIQLFAIVPMVLWIGRNILLGVGPLGVRPEELPDIGTSLGENAQLILRWFIPEKYLSLGAQAQGLLIIFLLLGMLAVFTIGQKNGSPFFTPIRTAIFIFVPIYVLLITVSVVIFQITAMQDRFLAPLLVPIILLFISAIEECIRLIQKSRWGKTPKNIMKLVVVSLPCLVLAGFLPRTIAFATQFERLNILTGNLYNDSTWNQKDIIKYLHDNPFKSEDVLYSNIAGGVAFHTWHTVFRSPRDAATVDPEKEYSLEMFRAVFHHPGKDLYLIWIEPSSYSHVFTPKALGTILNLERLVIFKDGSKIFQVKLLAPIE